MALHSIFGRGKSREHYSVFLKCKSVKPIFSDTRKSPPVALLISLPRLERVVELAGDYFHERIAEVKAEETTREELVEWAVSWILERLGKETPLIEKMKGMSARLGMAVDFGCEDKEMAERLRNFVVGEIFLLRVGKKKIADYMSEDERELYADYLAGSPRLAGRSW